MSWREPNERIRPLALKALEAACAFLAGGPRWADDVCRHLRGKGFTDDAIRAARDSVARRRRIVIHGTKRSSWWALVGDSRPLEPRGKTKKPKPRPSPPARVPRVPGTGLATFPAMAQPPKPLPPGYMRSACEEELTIRAEEEKRRRRPAPAADEKAVVAPCACGNRTIFFTLAGERMCLACQNREGLLG